MMFYRIKALLYRYGIISISNIDRYFDIFFWPLIDLTIWGFASYYFRTLSQENIVSVFLIGAVLRVFETRAAQDLAIYILEDYWAGGLYHILSSPLRIFELILSVFIVSIFRAALSFIFLTLVAYNIYSFNIFLIPTKLLWISILLLTLYGYSIAFFVTGCVIRFGQRIQVFVWSFIWIFQPFNCVFYPLESLPIWAQYISKYLPGTYIYENLRNYILHNTINYDNFFYAIMLIFIISIISISFFVNAFKYAKREGLFGIKV